MFKNAREFASGVYRSIELKVVQADITDEVVDAIVNAANEHLSHGGGVAGAISRRGGYSIQDESDAYVRKHGPVETGNVGITGPGRLPCKYVIHAVGPVFHGGNHGEDELLASAVYESLKKAHEMNLKSISIPAISSGIFGYPKPRCAKVMVKTAKNFIDSTEECSIREIRFTNFDVETTTLMDRELGEFFRDPEKEIVLEPFAVKEKEKRSSWGGSWWDSKGGYSWGEGRKEEEKKKEPEERKGRDEEGGKEEEKGKVKEEKERSEKQGEVGEVTADEGREIEEQVGKLRVEDEVGDDGLEKGKVSHDGEKDKGLSAERGEGGETPVKEPINE